MCSLRRSRRWLLQAVCLLAVPHVAAQGAAERSGGTEPPEQAADTRSREQLFQDVFRRPAPAMPVSGSVQVTIDGTASHKLRAVITPDPRALQVEGEALLAVLGENLRRDSVQQLRQLVDAAGWLSRSALESAGIATAYDPALFELALTTDPSLRERSVRYLTSAPPSTAGALRPAAASGFLNFNIRSAQRADTSAGVRQRHDETAVATDGAFNLRGVVLEGSGYAVSGTGHGFQRGDVRAVFDRPDEALRFSAGDVRYPVTGFQTLVQMGGVGVSRDFSLQPYRQSFQASQFEFYLERPAKVQVWVNASQVTTLQLPAGLHDIRGISPVLGLNTTRLIIEDVAGRTQSLDFSFFYSPALLERGVTAFSANAGYRRSASGRGYHYDMGDPVVSGSYLRGVRDDTTLGGYVQADAHRSLVGVQATFGSDTSTLQLDAAVRGTEGAPAGTGLRVNWSYSGDIAGVRGLHGQGGVEYLSPHFGMLSDSFPAARVRIGLWGNLGFVLDAANSFQLAINQRQGDVAFGRSSHNYLASWSRRLGRAMLTLGLRHRRTDGGNEDRGAFFGFFYAFSEGGNNLYAAKATETDALTLGWTSSRSSAAPGPYGFASTRVGSGSQEYTGGAGYWTHQAQAEVGHTRGRIDTRSGPFDREETSIRLQSAVVFADGALGLVSNVSENFAIVRGKEGLRGVDIRVDPDGQGGSRARSAWVIPAVVSDLGSYQLRDIRLEPVDPPIGATPDKLAFALLPGYKSGFLLEIGKEARIIAIGRLLDVHRQGLTNVPLEVRPVGAAQAEPIRTFTGRTGAFQLPDLRPGRYEIAPAGPRPWNTVIVDIPQTPDGLFRLGDIEVGP